jgi:hypothetical protein
MEFHIMPMDMVHDEWERVQERQKKESIRDPAVEDLQSLV